MQRHLQRSVADLAIVVPVKEVERFLGFSYLGRDYDDDGGNSEYDDYVRWRRMGKIIVTITMVMVAKMANKVRTMKIMMAIWIIMLMVMMIMTMMI